MPSMTEPTLEENAIWYPSWSVTLVYISSQTCLPCAVYLQGEPELNPHTTSPPLPLEYTPGSSTEIASWLV